MKVIVISAYASRDDIPCIAHVASSWEKADEWVKQDGPKWQAWDKHDPDYKIWFHAADEEVDGLDDFDHEVWWYAWDGTKYDGMYEAKDHLIEVNK